MKAQVFGQSSNRLGQGGAAVAERIAVEKGLSNIKAVSYTHLDVYKRQGSGAVDNRLTLNGLIAKLPPRQQEVIRLYYFEDLSLSLIHI